METFPPAAAAVKSPKAAAAGAMNARFTTSPAGGSVVQLGSPGLHAAVGGVAVVFWATDPLPKVAIRTDVAMTFNVFM